ncbi:glutathione S-transferase family protein [Lichenicola cladoniae]|uniref:Glutathione S-transferase family protein n=1 Tax=Lichenicola cladoniae TaxID=1484109 RepID=A0A6M8HM10_9PROT|nr:glutathione S-transferase family protein [Lichenicola cladoniae]NPD66842.1 glutathione S-transferase family protein [Acetobacteraceae bacterium]QKE89404.1 glutathione S-transferase family protein [Lichenicola cladoniae]
MGLLVDGHWQDQWYETRDGRFERQDSKFRNWVTPDGQPGPSGEGGFRAEPGRYHLYVSLACPWAHRTLIMRRLKGLEQMIGVSVTHWLMAEHGWTFEPGPGVVGDPINGARLMHEVYTAADPHYTGRVTVPVLWDRQRRTIVSNESADIVRMLNSAFDAIGATPGDYVPASLLAEIDAVNARVYATVNNGVYRAGFATTQEAYEEAVTGLFDTLDWLEQRLAGQRYLVGDVPTEADIRLFTTLIRFDPVYHGHFKCNLRRIVDYPNLSRFVADVRQWPGVAETIDLDHIKRHYYQSHKTINPTGIVPLGPVA